MKKYLRYIFVFSGFFMIAVSFTNCSQFNENELFDGTQASTLRCTANDCADLSPKAEELEIRAMKQITVVESTDAIEVNGDCNPSTYPKNKLRIQAVGPSGAQFAGGDATCKQGKFNVIISRATANGLVNCGKIYLTQVGVDQADKEYINPNSRPFDINFTVVNVSGTPLQFCNL